MLKGNTVLFKYLKHFSAKAHLSVHHSLFNIDCAKALFSRNTGNSIMRLSAGAFYNQSSLVLRLIGVADIDRDSFFSDRENCILVENACAHVGQLSQLLVCNRLNYLRILNNPGIRYQKAGYICPVFIQICMNGSGYNRSRHIGTASGKGFNRAVML